MPFYRLYQYATISQSSFCVGVVALHHGEDTICYPTWSCCPQLPALPCEPTLHPTFLSQVQNLRNFQERVKKNCIFFLKIRKNILKSNKKKLPTWSCCPQLPALPCEPTNLPALHLIFKVKNFRRKKINKQEKKKELKRQEQKS